MRSAIMLDCFLGVAWCFVETHDSIFLGIEGGAVAVQSAQLGWAVLVNTCIMYSRTNSHTAILAL
jgi:hypothetical protein